MEQRRSTSESGEDAATFSRPPAPGELAEIDERGEASRARHPAATVRRFVLDLPRHAAPRRSRVLAPLGVVLAIAALVLVAVGRSFAVRALLPIALALAAVGLLFRAARRSPRTRSLPPAGADSVPGPSARPTSSDAARDDHLIAFNRASSATGATAPGTAAPRRSLELDGAALALVTSVERKVLLDLAAPFGMTLLSNRRRDRVVLALTSRSGAFLLGGRVSTDERRSLGEIFARASFIPTDEVALDAIGPDGEPIELTGEDFKALVESLEAIDPAAGDRLLLSDPSGAPLELQGEELVVRSHTFDLTRPIEWRSILFQESFGQAFALYQGTWIRQGSSEVVLVSLLPASVLDPNPLDFETAGHPDLDVRAMRDQRLMQATAGAPPPNEQRVAVDGLFMLPLRVALDQAPRPSTLPASARHA